MNSYPKNVTDIHIELTDKCQASCPMCARNYSGGAERPFVGQNDISLEQFKNWFSPLFLKDIKNFYACGNYGDPIIAKDCLEIFEYVRSCTDGRLSIHTNGSARSTKWWSKLGKTLQGMHDVTFGIDGFAESHSLYRRGTDWNKIIDNVKSFINSGGTASVDCLVFKHNQNEINEFKEYMLSLGVNRVNIKPTGRFYDMEKFPVLTSSGSLDYYLEPADNKEYKIINFLKLEDLSKDISIWENIVASTTIEPKCIAKKEIYIDARGTVYPCCWIGLDMVESSLRVALPIHDLRNKVVENSKQHFKEFYKFNLHSMSIQQILLDKEWDKFTDINKDKPWTCSKNCNG